MEKWRNEQQGQAQILKVRLILISSGHGSRTENTVLLLLRACLLGCPRDRYPARPLAPLLLFTNRLGANYIVNTAPVLLAACLNVFNWQRGFLAPLFNALRKSITIRIRAKLIILFAKISKNSVSEVKISN
jgi:hypothetical protein